MFDRIKIRARLTWDHWAPYWWWCNDLGYVGIGIGPVFVQVSWAGEPL